MDLKNVSDVIGIKRGSPYRSKSASHHQFCNMVPRVTKITTHVDFAWNPCCALHSPDFDKCTRRFSEIYTRYRKRKCYIVHLCCRDETYFGMYIRVWQRLVSITCVSMCVCTRFVTWLPCFDFLGNSRGGSRISEKGFKCRSINMCGSICWF